MKATISAGKTSLLQGQSTELELRVVSSGLVLESLRFFSFCNYSWQSNFFLTVLVYVITDKLFQLFFEIKFVEKSISNRIHSWAIFSVREIATDVLFTWAETFPVYYVLLLNGELILPRGLSSSLRSPVFRRFQIWLFLRPLFYLCIWNGLEDSTRAIGDVRCAPDD